MTEELIPNENDSLNTRDSEIVIHIPTERNIYDQIPFNEIIASAVLVNPFLSPDDVRVAISTTVSIASENDAGWKELERARGREEMQDQQSVVIGDAVRKKLKGRFELPADADQLGRLLLEEIEKFPHLTEYILLKVLEGKRKINGENKKSGSSFMKDIPEDSYVLWASRKLRVSQNQVLLGIEKIFKQDVHREILAQIVSPSEDDNTVG